MIRLSYAAAAALLLAASLAAPSAYAQAAKPVPGDDPVVARVNGQPITRSAVIAVHESLPQQMRQLPIEQIYPNLINEIISRRLVNDAAEKAKIGDDAKVKEQLKSAREAVLQQAYLERTIDRELTDTRVQKRYDDLVKNQPPRDEVKARHILVASEADAIAALDEVKKGADFAETSKKRSVGPTATTGGDLGFFGKDQMVPEFAEAAFALQPGQVTQKPVKTQFGWHVIKVEERRTAPPPTLAEVRDELRELLVREIIEETIGGLRKNAKVEQYDWPGAGGGKLPTLAPQPKKP